MNLTGGPRVLIGVAGSIAAYKVPELCREFRDRGAEVAVVMTRAATRFVGPATFETPADWPAKSGSTPTAGSKMSRRPCFCSPNPSIRATRPTDIVVAASPSPTFDRSANAITRMLRHAGTLR